MIQEYILEIVDHSNGNIIGSDKGTASYFSMALMEILDALPDNCGITINKNNHAGIATAKKKKCACNNGELSNGEICNMCGGHGWTTK